jgi:hypothetical protein
MKRRDRLASIRQADAPDFESRALYARTARVIGERVVHGVHVMSVCAPRWSVFPALLESTA